MLVPHPLFANRVAFTTWDSAAQHLNTYPSAGAYSIVPYGALWVIRLG